MERVNGEECRYEHAPADKAGQAVEQEAEQDRIYCMEQQAGRVVPHRVQVEQLNVEHVG